MKALVLEAYNKLVFKDVPDPETGSNDVLIQVKACGICGSDVHGIDGSTGRRVPPLIMGHEAAGVIVECGESVSSYRIGQRVTFDSTIYCGVCYYCRRGYFNLCDNRRVLGVSCDEYRQNGAFAEYISVPQHILYPLPNKLNFVQAAVVEACAIAVHAVEKTPVSLNDTAVVIGAGMVGLLLIQALRTAGCGNIVAVDVDAKRLNLAIGFGADVGLDPRQEQIPTAVNKITRQRGADIAFEVVGIRDTLTSAISCLRKGGHLTLVGNLVSTVELPLQTVVTREITISGSCASRGEYPACLDMIANSRINVKPLISEVVPLSEGGLWFERLYQKELGLLKVILTP